MDERMRGCLLAAGCILLATFSSVRGQYWMSLGTQSFSLDTTKRTVRNKQLCNALPLHANQREVCTNYTDLMTSVAEGARMSIDECQYQFRLRQWNCTVERKGDSVFGAMMDKASRESGFINAITSAGVAYSVTEACAEGKSVHCRCDNSIRARNNEEWNWGGCNRPIAYGIWFSSIFIDKVETGANKTRKDARKEMNLHNNRAGREVMRGKLWTKCKCHGMSGNCNLKTCWSAQPSFKKIGDILKEKYDSAHEMSLEFKTNRKGKKKFVKLVPKYPEYVAPTPHDLIYFEDSPNFCDNDPKLGITGTKGRECNITSSGVDGCELMCCRRGYNVKIVQEERQCDCKFIWCCKVQCQQCTAVVPKYSCK